MLLNFQIFVSSYTIQIPLHGPSQLFFSDNLVVVSQSFPIHLGFGRLHIRLRVLVPEPQYVEQGDQKDQGETASSIKYEN